MVEFNSGKFWGVGELVRFSPSAAGYLLAGLGSVPPPEVMAPQFPAITGGWVRTGHHLVAITTSSTFPSYFDESKFGINIWRLVPSCNFKQVSILGTTHTSLPLKSGGTCRRAVAISA